MMLQHISRCFDNHFKFFQLNINECVPLILIYSAFEGQYQGWYDHRRTSKTHRKVSGIGLWKCIAKPKTSHLYIIYN